MSSNRRTTTPSPEFLTIRDAATVLGLSEFYLYRQATAGTLRVYRFGRAIRVTRVDLEAFAARAADGDR